MTFIMELIPEESKKYLEQKRDKFNRGMVTKNSCMGSWWTADYQRNAFLVGFGGMGPELTGRRLVFLWNDEVIIFYYETKSENNKLYFLLPEKYLMFPKSWELAKNFEEKKKDSLFLIKEGLIVANYIRDGAYSEIDIILDKNWVWGK